MRILFQNDTVYNKMNLYVSDTWTCLKRGEGEKEIANHGRSRVKESFSQETEAKSQQVSRNDMNEPKLQSKSQVQDAQGTRTQLPFFLFLKRKSENGQLLRWSCENFAATYMKYASANFSQARLAFGHFGTCFVRSVGCLLRKCRGFGFLLAQVSRVGFLLCKGRLGCSLSRGSRSNFRVASIFDFRFSTSILGGL